MERKIGEIFEYNNEWYQCLEEKTCTCFGCDFRDYNCDDISLKEVKGSCQSEHRKDNKHVIFKKLEKVGEPYMLEDKKFQEYKVFKATYIYHKIDCSWQSFSDPYYVSLEIKEDMEERKLIELLSEKVHNAWMKEKEAQGFSYGKDYDKEKKKHPDMLPYNELKEEVKEYDRATVRAVLQAQKELQSKYNYNNLKPFDLEAAKAGKPVCTRDGHKVRIICFDYNGETGDYPIVALVHYNKGNKCYERVLKYTSDGLFNKYGDYQHDDDLMMLPEKKEGWVNIYKSDNGTYYTGAIFYEKNDALVNTAEIEITTGIPRDCIDTINIFWEE